MRFTNKYGLPSPIVRAVTRHKHRVSGDISVTQLVQPIRIRQLYLRHDAEIEEDVSERLWMLMGSAVHSVLEEASVPDALQEEQLCVEVPGTGWKLSGTPDLYTDEPRLSDYKFTSVWATLNGVKPEWEAQVNLYRWLYAQYGFECEHLEIVALLRDWNQTRELQGGNYPPVQCKVLPVRMWPLEKTEAYIRTRIALHKLFEDVPDKFLPICTPKERWQKPTMWAVKKRGRKRALRVLDSLQEAQAYMALRQNQPLFIEERLGKPVRCIGCSLKHWCNWWQAEQARERKEKSNDSTRKGKANDSTRK